jgi:hypothetical protein
LEVEFDDFDRGSFVYVNRDTGESLTGTLSPPLESAPPPLAVTAILSAFPAVVGV